MGRADWINLLLFLHVLGAVTALGPTLTYALWIRRAEGSGAPERAFALRTISWIDRRLATPSYVSQAVTGTVLILLTGRSLLGTAWLLSGVVLYAIMVVFAVGLYAPAFRRQRGLAERLREEPRDGELGAEYRRLASRAAGYGWAAVVLTVLILYLMVAKPALWSSG